MIHADRLAKAQHSLAVAAFAVYVHTCLRIYVSRLTSFSYTYVRAWLIAYAHKDFPTVLLRRILFLRKHHPMDFPPFCLAARSLSSSSFVLIVL